MGYFGRLKAVSGGHRGSTGMLSEEHRRNASGCWHQGAAGAPDVAISGMSGGVLLSPQISLSWCKGR